VQALRFWAIAAELLARHKVRRRARRPRTVRLRVNGAPLAIAVRDIGELHGLREVFVRGDYALTLQEAPRTILDLGANVGAAAVHFATRWPAAEVIALEPDPDAFERLVRNTRAFPSVRPLQLAIAADAGDATLYRTGFTLTNSLMKEHGGEPITVRAVSLDWLLDGPCAGRVDLLKFDVEGSEFAALRAFERQDQIPVLVGELHADAMGASLEEFAGLFPGHEVEITPLPNGEHLFRAVRRGAS
jgi:FkbM family methyltransferase